MKKLKPLTQPDRDRIAELQTRAMVHGMDTLGPDRAEYDELMKRLHKDMERRKRKPRAR